ncbi:MULTISPECIES: alpha/beta fold hydrolase [Klebsiella]|jgi:Predicted hydrolases or acyltransferases (alpha/beta hydrolase superfamily)|uniref:alpha/beta fold hydrolase n=1 Tax=Klebsiella TaxID=570 RepID=UPI00063C776C|nr:alpha/beta fold hydrolase [Klebsiella aerogenes]EIW9477234.1 alpha/beta fold hydrolase [Klebsiella aerogenes]EIW9497437.1 alpha/beta fold hydrolase [Klebsiella aerogenes]EKM7513331.1 alpha/beta fold hydrolase [Klebsiella aerogenes]ELW9549413.1 alpha/beta fold hydrolase [Klebsiella aerogenes]KLF22792.1 3-oxoadipate enol-lactonase [Klebsiella aerogenes]
MFIRPLKLTQHVDVQGPENAKTVILLHSLGTDMHLWDLQMPRLTERYRVVRLDIRGHGLSAVDALPFSMEDLADDVIAVVDHLNINKFYVVGVSIGGTIAQWIGFKLPQRVQGMVIIDTSLVNAAPPSLWRARAEDVFQHGLEHLERGIISNWVTPQFIDSPEADGLRKMLRNTTVEAFSGCSLAIADTDLTNMDIHGVSAVIVRGAEDKLTPQDYAQRLAKKRNAELHVIPGASHLPNLEKPDALTDEIITFIEKAQTH